MLGEHCARSIARPAGPPCLLAALIFQSTRANRRLNFLEHCGAFGVQAFRLQFPSQRKRCFDRFPGLTLCLLYGLNSGLTVKPCGRRFGHVSHRLSTRACLIQHQFQTRDFRAARFSGPQLACDQVQQQSVGAGSKHRPPPALFESRGVRDSAYPWGR